MPTDFKIKIDGTDYDKDWILNNSSKLVRAEYSKISVTIFDFLNKWFTGEEIFEVSTSGSTGQPKEITIQKRQMVLSAEKTLAALDLGCGDKALLCITPHYIGGLMMLVRSLVGDLQLTVVKPTGNPFEKLSHDEDFDFTALVPLQLVNVLNDEKSSVRLSGLKAVIVGGAPISSALEIASKKISAPIYQTFGMTETVSHIALRRLNGVKAEKSYSVLPGVQISQDERGCLVIESDIIEGQKLITNDVVEITGAGKFSWIGRADNIINSGGVKVNPEKVEQAIFEIISGSVNKLNFFVTGLPDGSLGERVVAIFEKKMQKIIREDTLLKSLQKKLSQYEIPKNIYFVEELVRTSTGKISRLANILLLQNQ